MSSLTAADKLYLERVLDIAGGYVLNFTDATFGQFFNSYDIDIDGLGYRTYGRSKAKKMRAFWEKEPDILVGYVLSEMLDAYEVLCDSGVGERDSKALRKSRDVVSKLRGPTPQPETILDERFLSKEIPLPNVQKLPLEFAVSTIVQDRLKEAQTCYRSAHTCQSSSNVAAFWRQFFSALPKRNRRNSTGQRQVPNEPAR